MAINTPAAAIHGSMMVAMMMVVMTQLVLMIAARDIWEGLGHGGVVSRQIPREAFAIARGI